MRPPRLCKKDEGSVKRPMTEYRACPVKGCKHHKLVRRWDLEYEIVTCPEHGFQYPVPPTCVPSYLTEKFQAFVRSKPQPHPVYNVFTPAAWEHFAQEFMRHIASMYPGEDPWGRFGPYDDEEGDWY